MNDKSLKKVVPTRLTLKDYQALLARAKLQNISPTEAARQAIRLYLQGGIPA